MKVVVALLLLVCCAVLEVNSCATSGDCAANECCVSNTQPIGKRQLSIRGGTCRSLGGSGDGCLVSTTAYDASRMYYSCPCETGLKCVGRGLYEVPLGEVGICS